MNKIKKEKKERVRERQGKGQNNIKGKVQGEKTWNTKGISGKYF